MPAASGPIPVTRTGSQVEFDQLTDTLNGRGLSRLRTTIGEMRNGLSSPERTARALRAIGPAMTSLRRGTRPLLGERPDDLQQLISGTAKTVAGLSRDDTALRDLVTGAAQTTQVTAEERSAVGASLRLMPASLQQTRSVARRLDDTLGLLDPLAVRLRPGLRALLPAAQTLRPFLDRASSVLVQAKPLLRDLSPAVRALHGVAVHGRPLLDDLAPVLERLDSELLPFLERVDPDTARRTIDMIGPTVAGVANASSQFDAAGNILHFGVLGDERTPLSLPCQSFVTDPSATEKVRCDALQNVLRSALSPVSRKGR
jgi:hypothetical protein